VQQRCEHERTEERRDERGFMIARSIDWNAATKVRSSVLRRPGMTHRLVPDQRPEAITPDIASDVWRSMIYRPCFG
jgi:hypothetical protein